jgi:hypothetical protein
MSDTSLTGALNTGKILKIADQPVTVTVSRTPLPGREADFERWAERSVSMLSGFPGSLGVGILRPGEAGGEWHIVFRFVDGLALRNWERSPERAELLAESDEFVAETKVQRTVGVGNWFDLPARAQPKSGFLHRMVGDALWVYPVSLGMAIFVAPHLSKMELWARVLTSGVLFAFLSQVLIKPTRTWIRRRRQWG